MKFFHNVTAKIAPAFSSKAALKSTAPQNKAPERTEKKVRSFRFFAAGLVLAAVSGLLGLCARTVPGFAQFYSVTVYPLLAGYIGTVVQPVSIFPFRNRAVFPLPVLHMLHDSAYQAACCGVLPCPFFLLCPVIRVHHKLRHQLLPEPLFPMRQALPQKKPPPRSCWRCAVILQTKSTAL